MKLLAAACSFLLLLVVLIINVACVAESRPVANNSAVVEPPQRRHHDHGGHHHSDDNKKRRPTHKLLVFGDEAADNGNGASDPALGIRSRGWRYPFGSSDKVHGRKPTGRLSDGLVQSDYVAMIMGHRESPPAYNSDDWDDASGGMNFAVGGARALKAPGVPTLGKQVQQLRDLVRDGVVTDDDLKDYSVALVAYSGNDYGDAHDDMTLDALVTEVVDEVSSVVSDLLDLGVAKVLVDTLPPFGCSAWQAKGMADYSSCNYDADEASDKHNAALRERLGDEAEAVMLLDLDTVFADLVDPKEGSTLSAEFSERLRPCCEAFDDDGYCGQYNRYSICDRPDEYFYWDFYGPTQAGWRAVMRLLQGPIMAFLGISNLNHF
ncbi:hypothetical protein U9M48_011349 [Paspalum notatum var. saurae]|uniref:GDSL esterase/lipase n=1 Tax=Paspalum notatum var. saurae TaxID=547442 RepID=A0AAQ3SVJ9_PASNO